MGLSHSGDTWLQCKDTLLMFFVELDFIREVRSWTYETHIPYKDIVELREFIDIEFPYPFSKRRHSRIVFYLEERTILPFVFFEQFPFFFLRIDDHGTELIHLEKFPVFPYSLALIERTMFILHINEQGYGEKNRRKDDEGEERADDIEYPFPDTSPWSEADILYLDHRDFSEKRDFRVDLGGLERIRDITVTDTVDTGIFEYFLDLLSREIALYDEYFIDFMGSYRRNYLFHSSDERNAHVSYLSFVRIPENPVHGGPPYGPDDIFLIRPDDEEDLGFLEYSFLDEDGLDPIKDASFQDDEKSTDYDREKDYQTWNLCCIEKSER